MPPVYIYEDHHHVLKTWSRLDKCNVISFDYHTDTHLAFQNYSYHKHDDKGHSPEKHLQLAKRERSNLIWKFRNNKLSINQCIDNLRHDEHIDFAVRAGIVNQVYVVPSGFDGGNAKLNKRIFNSRLQHKYNKHPIVEYHFYCLPTCEKMTHDDNCQVDCAAKAIDDVFIEPALQYISKLNPSFFSNVILDIDLDYFRSINSFSCNNTNRFKWLIKNAIAITIAKESNCVEFCRLDGSSITADMALECLNNLIKNVK